MIYIPSSQYAAMVIHRKHPYKWMAEVTATIILVFIFPIMIIIGLRFHQISDDMTTRNHPYRYNNPITTTTDSIRPTNSNNIYTTIRRMIHRSMFLNHDDRIVGGTPVDNGEFPFFVHPIGMMLCGATLIHPEYVHTLASSF